MNTTFTNAWNRLVEEVFAWLPKLAGAFVVLVIGLIIAAAIARMLKKIFNQLGLDPYLRNSAVGRFLSRAVSSPTEFLSSLVYWILALGVAAVAARLLGIPSVNGVVGGIYRYLPHVIAALAIFMVAVVITGSVTTLIRNTMGHTPTGKLLESLVPIIIMSIAVFMILDELQIASSIVIITYAALIGSLSLASALAFGLGGRDLASRMLDETYQKAKAAAPLAHRRRERR